MPTLEDFGALSYVLVAGLSGVFALLLLISWRGRAAGILLLVATLINAVWATAAAVEAVWGILPSEWIWALESLRTLAWVLFLTHLLELQHQEASRSARHLRSLQISLLAVALILCLPVERWAAPLIIGAEESLLQGRLFGHLLLIVVGLALVEQVYRNTLREHRKDIRFLCLGLGAMFGFDFFVYADAMLVNRIDPELWLMRGPLNVFVIPLLANSAAHNPQWSVHLFVSRTIVFHSAGLAATGAYLVLMSMAGYWVRAQGDVWGSAPQVLFFLGAVGCLLVLVFSRDLRAWLKVFIAKNFYRSKFDYRHEWIRATGRLSGQGLRASLPERIVVALGEAVDRPGGAIWVADGQGQFRWETCVECEKSGIDAAWDATEFCRALEQIGWILDLAEYAREPGLYPGLEVPPWMGDLRHFSLVVPILHDHRILSFVVLVKPRVPDPLNWETIDLLKTTALQAASYLALEETAYALAEARQFEGFNRVSAFVVHDLKNLVAQLNLVVRNAERHKGNPAFIDDAFETVGSAVTKMNRLLLQLRGITPTEKAEQVDLRPLLKDLVVESARRAPVPVLEVGEDVTGLVNADAHRLAAVIDNVIRNAQEATDRSGRVQVRLAERNREAVVEIEDTGIGMDEDFVRNRLFRPFDSTKGLAGMGIGAYDCREYVQGLGGRVEVTSRPGEGTCFRIRIPLASETQGAAKASLRPQAT